MQNSEKKPGIGNGNSNGKSNAKIIPIAGKQQSASGKAAARDAFWQSPRPRDLSPELAAVGKMGADRLLDEAAYSPHPEVRKKALGMLAENRYGLEFVVRHSPHADTTLKAADMLKALGDP